MRREDEEGKRVGRLSIEGLMRKEGLELNVLIIKF
jgi:hypothetical protein